MAESISGGTREVFGRKQILEVLSDLDPHAFEYDSGVLVNFGGGPFLVSSKQEGRFPEGPSILFEIKTAGDDQDAITSMHGLKATIESRLGGALNTVTS